MTGGETAKNQSSLASSLLFSTAELEALSLRTQSLLENLDEKYEEAAMHGWGGVASTLASAQLSLEKSVREIDSAETFCRTAQTLLNGLSEKPSLLEVIFDLSAARDQVLSAGGATSAGAEEIGLSAEQCQHAGMTSMAQMLVVLREQFEVATADLVLREQEFEAERAMAEAICQDRLGESEGSGSGSGGPSSSIEARMDEMRREGHGPQRHGPTVTEGQLADRALRSIDPMTGTPVDGDHGGLHRCGRNATKVTSSEAFVQADQHLRRSQEFANLKNGPPGRAKEFPVERPLSEIYGPDYRRHVRGVRRGGSKKFPTGNPPGSVPPSLTDFSEGTMKGVYVRQADGTYATKTLFPKPAEESS